MISQWKLHEYIDTKLYKIMNWKVEDVIEDEVDGHPWVYSIVKNQFNPYTQSSLIVLEKFHEEMANDILFGYTVNEKNQPVLNEINYVMNTNRVKNENGHYIICGEYNVGLMRFFKAAVIDVDKFCEAYALKHIAIDMSFRKKESYIENGVLYGVAIRSQDKTFVAFDIGMLAEINPDIIFYQFGFLTYEQRINKNFATEKQIKYIEKLLHNNALSPTKSIAQISKGEASALIAYLTGEHMKLPEIHNLLHNRVTLNILGKYIKG